MTPTAQHYDFTCDFDPSHQSLGHDSGRLPEGWRFATTSYIDERGNEIKRTFTVCPQHAALIMKHMLSVATEDSVAHTVIWPQLHAA